MTVTELEELITHCPRLYHMDQRGAWPGISRHGLLSTTGLLDLFGVQAPKRDAIERAHRPEIVELDNAILGKASIRDQSPMNDQGLLRVLPPDISPADWYARLNGMVFFWLSEKRLLRLSHARAYRDTEHEILVLDTRRFIAAQGPKIWLCPINSGATKPFPAPRGHGTLIMTTRVGKPPGHPASAWWNSASITACPTSAPSSSTATSCRPARKLPAPKCDALLRLQMRD